MMAFTRALLIAALSAPLAASAQDAPKDPSKEGGTPKATETGAPKEAQKLSEDELQIIALYHQDNVMEAELGKVANKRGTSPDVRSFGEMMTKDHGALDRRLMDLTRKTGQAIPEPKPESDAAKQHLQRAQETSARLKQLEGASFEREYLRFMVEDHAHVLSNIDAHIAEAKHPELARILREAKPILQRHEAQARELQQKLQLQEQPQQPQQEPQQESQPEPQPQPQPQR